MTVFRSSLKMDKQISFFFLHLMFPGSLTSAYLDAWFLMLHAGASVAPSHNIFPRVRPPASSSKAHSGIVFFVIDVAVAHASGIPYGFILTDLGPVWIYKYQKLKLLQFIDFLVTRADHQKLAVCQTCLQNAVLFVMTTLPNQSSPTSNSATHQASLSDITPDQFLW